MEEERSFFFFNLFSNVLSEGLDIFILGPKNSSKIGKWIVI